MNKEACDDIIEEFRYIYHQIGDSVAACKLVKILHSDKLFGHKKR